MSNTKMEGSTSELSLDYSNANACENNADHCLEMIFLPELPRLGTAVNESYLHNVTLDK